MRQIIILTMLLLFSNVMMVQAQSSFDVVLQNIEKNNKTLEASTHFLEAKNLQYRTGNAPEDPTVGYDYLAGNSVTGSQTELAVVQSFDFPTVYVKRKQLADGQVAQSQFQLEQVRQSIRLEAKMLLLELIHLRKQHLRLKKVKGNTERILLDFEKRLEKGDGNVMDVNKARLQLLDAKKRVTENETAISSLNTKLVEFNGGIDVTFSDTIYPIYQEVPQFEVIEAELEANDPSREILEQQEVIVQKKVELSKAVWFPKIEAGYRRTTGGGQAFNGVHTGISVPLWENRNTVKQQKVSLQYAQANLDEHRTEHFYEIKQLYDRFVLLKESVEEYEKTLAAMNTKVLLNKALEVGHISTIEYFMELNFYEQAFDRYLETEAEYYRSVAELLRYR